MHRCRVAHRHRREWQRRIFHFDAEADVAQNLIAGESWRQQFIALRRLEQSHPLGNLPLVVLVRTQHADQTLRNQAAQLAALSTAGRLVPAENSGHEFHLYRPDLVIRAIQEVVTAARNQPAQPAR